MPIGSTSASVRVMQAHRCRRETDRQKICLLELGDAKVSLTLAFKLESSEVAEVKPQVWTLIFHLSIIKISPCFYQGYSLENVT